MIGGVLSGPLYGRCVTDLSALIWFAVTSLSLVSDFQEISNLRVQSLFASPLYAIMSSISDIVSFFGILLAASSSAFSVSDINTVVGDQKLFTYHSAYRVYIMDVTVGRFLSIKSSLRSYSDSTCHSGGMVWIWLISSLNLTLRWYDSLGHLRETWLFSISRPLSQVTGPW